MNLSPSTSPTGLPTSGGGTSVRHRNQRRVSFSSGEGGGQEDRSADRSGREDIRDISPGFGSQVGFFYRTG